MSNAEIDSSAIAPPLERIGIKAWLRKNLFSSWHNSLLTLIVVSIFAWILGNLVAWATTTAQWQIIKVNFPLFFVGRFPKAEYWRIWTIFGLICGFSGLSWGVIARGVPKLFSRNILIGVSVAGIALISLPTPVPFKILNLVMLGIVVGTAWLGKQLGKTIPGLGKSLALGWFGVFLASFWLLKGGLGLETISTNNWGGLTLTLFASVVSIVLCFPIGMSLALARQSSLPVVRWLSTIYIEVIRGVPLVSILFMGQVILPLFLPEGIRPDRVVRAIAGLSLFYAAYVAEDIRGGLQSLPRGQTEAAKALGLNSPLIISLIILPQALKISLPALVGQFISLFQDTTLLAIVGLVELLGITRNILAQPQFLGRYAEAYLFDGILFWIFCYGMSQGSRKLESVLNKEN